MKWLAPAKINLSLRVLGRRDDGFHEIETLMVPLTLADELEVELLPLDHHGRKAGPIDLVCDDPSLPNGPENLAYRAAELFRERAGRDLPSVRINLSKKVPHGAGLGGGSSDAAAVLLALNMMCGPVFTPSQLAAIAAEIGSDIPFFIYQSAAVCRGRGEIVQPVPFQEDISLLLLKPPFPIPTPWAYKRWRDSREIPEVRYGAQSFSWGVLINDLERPVFEKYLLLANLKMWLLAQPEVTGALLSGSGSTVLAVLRDSGADPAPLADRAKAAFGELWTCTCRTLVNKTPA